MFDAKAYQAWRAALLVECRSWLTSNHLDASKAVYLANFIERTMPQWAERAGCPWDR